MSRIRVPGNLLLLGEYAVLEPGGLGLAMAAAPFVEAAAAPARGFTVSGMTNGVTVGWSPDTGGDEFLGTAVGALARALREQAGIEILSMGLSISLDSRAFFNADGSKRGFGSSAAVVAALVITVLRRSRQVQPAADAAIDAVDRLQTAVDVHRAVQGGRGSGYDVAASLHGGVGVFRGGRRPQYRRIDHGLLPRLFLSPGAAAVDTRVAIERYRRLHGEAPSSVERYLEASNRAVTAFADARDWASQRAALVTARQAAVVLGEKIGVPARPAFPDDEHSVTKCLGAGDELVARFVDPAAVDYAPPPLLPPPVEVFAAATEDV